MTFFSPRYNDADVQTSLVSMRIPIPKNRDADCQFPTPKDKLGSYRPIESLKSQRLELKINAMQKIMETPAEYSELASSINMNENSSV